MTSIIRIVLAFLAFTFSAAAFAQADRGVYRCAWCVTQSIPGDQMDGTTSAFQLANINPNLVVPMYRPNDTLTICNGTNCMTFTWLALNGWKLKYMLPDTGQATHGDTARNIRGIGAEDYHNPADYCVSQVVYNGHWEWWDFYSNGEYIESWGFQYVVTSSVVGTRSRCV